MATRPLQVPVVNFLHLCCSRRWLRRCLAPVNVQGAHPAEICLQACSHRIGRDVLGSPAKDGLEIASALRCAQRELALGQLRNSKAKILFFACPRDTDEEMYGDRVRTAPLDSEGVPLWGGQGVWIGWATIPKNLPKLHAAEGERQRGPFLRKTVDVKCGLKIRDPASNSSLVLGAEQESPLE